MKNKHLNLALFMLISACFSNLTFGQSSAYEDASSPLGAVGMMQMTLHANALIKSKCTGKFPFLAAEIEDNLSKWQENESHNISIAEAKWPGMVNQEPKFLQMIELQEKTLNGILNSFEQMPKETGDQMYLNTCRKRFAELASGIWRRRTPLAYRYLDEMQ
jgi:hypothetical protein